MNLSEDGITEFKREYTPEINKTIVAFANTNGGTLYIGVANDGKIFGVDEIDSVMLKTGNNIRDSIKPDVTMFMNYQKEVVKSKEIIKITVQKGVSCPYYIAGKGLRPEGVYVRQGASTVPASEAAILRMIKETDGGQFEEERSLNQELMFNELKNEFEKQNILFDANHKKSLNIFNSDGIYTNLALILSDQNVHTIKLAVFEGNDKIIFKDRREFTGSLIKQLNDIYEFIDRCNRLHSETDGLRRVDKRDYPEDAVREALVNALVHRDYAYSDSTLVSIFDDRIEIVSIGGLVKGITFDDMMLGVSIKRNKNLANVFYRLTLIEAYGTGIPKIMRSYRDYHVKPKIEITENVYKVTLPNCNAEAKKSFETDNEKTILSLFNKRDFIIRKDVEEVLSVSQTMAGRLLKKLSDKHVIKAVGGGKNTRYVLKDGR